MTQLVAGDTAPDFTLQGTNGETTLSTFKDQTVIIYFFPAAMTPGCTVQAVDFTAAKDDFADAGMRIIGISPDSLDRLNEFKETNDITITMLSDADKEVIHAYGAWGSKNVYGKHVEGVERSTFIVDIDSEGVATVKLAQYNVRATGHVDRLKRELGLENS